MKIYADGRKKLSPSDVEQVVVMYKDGKSCDAIARVFECDVKTIIRALKVAKVKMRSRHPKNFSSPDCRRIVDMYEAGQKLDDIAAIFKCSRGPIRSVLHRFGVTIRPGGDLIITPEVAQRMLDLYRQGWTQKQIAIEFKSSFNRVHDVLSQFDLEFRQGGHRKVPRDAYPGIIESYQNGNSTRTIAQEWDCTRQTIANILRQTGVLHGNEATSSKFRHAKKESLSLVEMERQFWQEEGRAIDMIMLPPELQRQILDNVADALRYALETLANEQ